jgi:hypothetical protein
MEIIILNRFSTRDAVRTTDPPVSEKQRRAMFAAAAGHSTLGIPKKVGEEFVGKADSHDCGGDCGCDSCRTKTYQLGYEGQQDYQSERGYVGRLYGDTGVLEVSPLFIRQERAQAWIDEQVQKLQRMGKKAWGKVAMAFVDPSKLRDAKARDRKWRR